MNFWAALAGYPRETKSCRVSAAVSMAFASTRRASREDSRSVSLRSKACWQRTSTFCIRIYQLCTVVSGSCGTHLFGIKRVQQPGFARVDFELFEDRTAVCMIGQSCR